MRRFLFFFWLLLTFPAVAAPPPAPTGVVAFAPNQSRAHLSWTDVSGETQYYVDQWDAETSTWDAVGTLPANYEVFRAAAPSSAVQEVKFRVAASNSSGTSAWVEAVVEMPAGTLDLFENAAAIFPEGDSTRAGEAFSFPAKIHGGAPESFFLEGAPAGVVIHPTTGVTSGMVATPGVYRYFVGATFNEGADTFKQVRFLRVLRGPSQVVVDQPIVLPAQDITVDGYLYLDKLFRDTGRTEGAWFETTLGSFVVALYDEATPKTVSNFLSYAQGGDYDGSFLHRADQGFVIQGGGARPSSSSAPPTSWRKIGSRGVIANESGISNVRGTIAMAKSGTVDSATSEWFISLGANNPMQLNSQAGGFTAFGQVLGSGMAVVDALSRLTVRNYNGVITGVASTPGSPGVLIAKVPVLEAVAPAVPGPNSLVKIFSVIKVPPVAIDVVGNSNPALASATVYGHALHLKSTGKTGTTQLTLRGTNADGNWTDHVLTLRIEDRNRPGFRISAIRGVRPAGTILVRGRAVDDVKLGQWRYRINKKRWMMGGRLNGKEMKFSKKIRGFRLGTNLLEIEVFDASRNRSGVFKQRLTFN